MGRTSHGRYGRLRSTKQLRMLCSLWPSPAPGSISVPASTKKVANRAPWGLGANFIEFLPASGTNLTVTFDGENGYKWRPYVIGTPAHGNATPTSWEITLNASSSGSLTINHFGTNWSKLTLIPTIADQDGASVPFSYSAKLEQQNIRPGPEDPGASVVIGLALLGALSMSSGCTRWGCSPAREWLLTLRQLSLLRRRRYFSSR